MIVFGLFVIAVIVQIVYALYFFRRILLMPRADHLTGSLRRHVSVIICAKNESANLKRNLPSILSQKYHDELGRPMYEVIVVNDASEDDSAAILQDMEQQYANLWDVAIAATEKRTMPGKKFALSKGMQHATHDWLVLIDADCAPASTKWLEMMVAPLAHGKEIVAGYGAFYKRKGLLNAFIRWETLHTFLQYSTYTLAGKPYMAVGRNLACTKKALQAAERSEVWTALPSGDDDLLVSISGNSGNTAVVCERAAFTFSPSKNSWREWIGQKQRHLSTGKYYSDQIKLLLGTYATSHADLWLCFFILFFLGFGPAALLFMAVRCAIYWFLWAAAARKLRQRNLVALFPLFDLGWMIYNFAFLPYIAWKNKQQWK